MIFTQPTFDFELRRRSLRLRTFDALMDFNGVVNSAGSAQTLLTPELTLTSGIGANKVCFVDERDALGREIWGYAGVRAAVHMAPTAVSNPTVTSYAGLAIGNLLSGIPFPIDGNAFENVIQLRANFNPGFETWEVAWWSFNGTQYNVIGIGSFPSPSVLQTYRLEIFYTPGIVRVSVNNHAQAFGLTLPLGAGSLRPGSLFVTSGSNVGGRTDASFDTYSWEAFGRETA